MRKCYRLTDLGRKELKNEKARWASIQSALRKLWAAAQAVDGRRARTNMFDLEKAVKARKKGLAENQALEDTDFIELEAALRDEVADRVRRGEDVEEAFRLASAGKGESKDIGAEFFKVHSARG
jgi:hypothetical protein